MASDKASVEAYAMQAERLTEGYGGSVSIDAIGRALGLPPEDSGRIADYLGKLGWAVPNFGPRILTLTPKGYDEIKKLHWPRWWRWIDNHPAIVAAVLSPIGGVIGSLLLKLLEKWLWP